MSQAAVLSHDEAVRIGKRDRKMRTFNRYMFLVPAMTLFIIFFVLPLAMGLIYSFTDYNMIQPWSFCGLNNFKKLFLEDDLFIEYAIPNTLQYAVIVGPSAFFLSFFFAWIIDNLKAKKAFAMGFYIPSLCSGLAMSKIWLYFFANDRYGLINYYLLKFDIITEPVLWTTDAQYIMPVIIFVQLMMSFSTQFLVFIAGFQNIPKDYYEAAQIDGIKNKFQELAYITWPQMKPQLLFGAINGIVGAFGVYDIAVAIAGFPSPDYAAHTIVAHMNDYAFIRFQMGYASAISLVLSITTFVLGRICMRIFRDKD